MLLATYVSVLVGAKVADFFLDGKDTLVTIIEDNLTIVKFLLQYTLEG